MIQSVKSLPAVWGTGVQCLGWEDLLEEGMGTPSSILAWRIPRTEERGRLQSMGSQRVGHDWVTEQQQHPRLCAVGPTARGDEHSSSSWS